MQQQLILNSLYRSGKTILQMALNSHSKIRLVSHGAMPIFMAWNRQFPEDSGYKTFAPLCVEYFEPRAIDSELLDQVEFDQSEIDALAQKMTASKKFESGRKGVDADSLHSWMDSFAAQVRPGTARSVFMKLLDSLPASESAESDSIKGFMDQFLDQFLPPMLAGMPSMQVVNVTRDPRAIAASRNFGDYVMKQGGGKKHPILLLARMWRTSLQYQRALREKYPSQFHTLAYENMMSQPEVELPAICEFLGVDFEPQMLDSDNYRDEHGELWRHNSSFGSSSGFDPSTNTRWKKYLPAEYQAALEFLLFPEMQELGYEPESSETDARQAFLGFSEDSGELAEWTMTTDLILDDRQRDREVERVQAIIKRS